jgi:hypothetical protein
MKFRGHSEMQIDFLRDAQRLDNLLIEIPKTPIITSTADRFVSFGSCFACNIKQVMEHFWDEFYFNRDICAHYNTSTMAALLSDLAEGRERSQRDLVRYDDAAGGVRAFNYFLKKRFVGEDDEKQALAEIKRLDIECHERIRECDHFIITIGTSLVVVVKESGRPINRGGGFRREALEGRFLGVAEIEHELEIMVNAIAKIRGGSLPNIIFTISPQRYGFDRDMHGRSDSPFVINCITKSILRVALDNFLQNRKDRPLYYYPAYEIVLDELRLFETISTYDFLHIEQSLTPKYVVKRFLKAFASDNVLRQLTLIDEHHKLFCMLEDFIHDGKLPKTPHFDGIVRQFVDRSIDIVDGNAMSLKLLDKLKQLLTLMQLEEAYPQVMNMTAVLTRKMLAGKRVIIWGTSGNYEKKIADQIQNIDFELVGFMDNDQAKWGKNFHGFNIYPPDTLGRLRPDCVLVASMFKDEISNQINSMDSSMEVVKLRWY